MYKIQVKYKSTISSASGLEEKVSNENGVVSWSWKINKNTSAGEYPITISSNLEEETFKIQIE